MVASRRLSEGTKGIDPFAVALVVAAIVHLGLLGWRVGGDRRVVAPDVANFEIEVVAWQDAAQGAFVLPSPERMTVSSNPSAVLPERSAPSAVAIVADEEAFTPASVPSEPEGLSSPGDAPSTTVAKATTPRPGVRLFLGASDLNDLVGRPRSAEQGPSSSAALFSEGTGKGSEVGVTASSPAISAGYRAARLAPETGTAVFEVRTNAAGVVTAVYLLSDDESGVWSGVTADLLARLAQSALRLPDGAKGMITRLRIDRGYLAKDLADRGKVTRGVALGQEHHEKDLGWEESTQGSTRPGRLTPMAALNSAWLHHVIPTRVVLLSQEFL